MNSANLTPRRKFVLRSTALGTCLTIPSFLSGGAAAEENGKEAEEISPAEDLMREHGVLRRRVRPREAM
jgi:hypothetical protein